MTPMQTSGWSTGDTDHVELTHKQQMRLARPHIKLRQVADMEQRCQSLKCGDFCTQWCGRSCFGGSCCALTPDKCSCRRTPNEPVSVEELRRLGVLSWHFDSDDFQSDPKLAAIRAARGYSYQVPVGRC